MNRYPGIRPFTTDDQHLFYGRDKEQRDLTQMVVLNDVVVLFGNSGTGKSSLLNAGVCPQFENRNLHPVFIRLNNTDLPPEKQIYQYLKEHGYIPREMPEGLSLWEYFKRFWYVDLGEVFTPVIIFDQFEELFTLYTPEERQKFIDQFADLTNDRMPDSLKQKLNQVDNNLDRSIDWQTPPRVKFILSIRSDFLYLLDELSTHIPSILRARFQLHKLNSSNAIQAITLPALAPGKFDSPTFGYEEESLNQIVRVLGKKETDNFRSDLSDTDAEIEAFQLQLFCQQIENKIKVEKRPKGFKVAPEFFGGTAGIKKIIGEFYSGVISRIPAEHQVAVQTMIATSLIRNKRRVIMEESAIRDEYEIPQSVLDQLDEERLLRKEARIGNLYYEVSHDSLIRPILKKYQGIVEEHEKETQKEERIAREEELKSIKQKIAEEQQRAEDEVKLRLEAQKSERKARQRTRLATWAFLVALVLALTSLVFWKMSVDEKRNAIKAVVETEMTKAFLEEKQDSLEDAQKSLIEAIRIADSSTTEAINSLVQANTQKAWAEVQTEIANKAKLTAEEAKVAAELQKVIAEQSAATAELEKIKALDEKAKAKKAEKRADSTRRELLVQKLAADSSLAIADSLNAQNQGLISSFYFYDDKFALASQKRHGKNKFGFVDKNGDEKIGYDYDEAQLFDERGFAKVKIFGKDNAPDTTFIIDTIGRKFLYTESLSLLDHGTEALRHSGKKTRFFPYKITKNPQLKILLIGSNRIKSIPNTINSLSNLIYLDLHSNQLITLPSKFGFLPSLVYLDLSFNKIKKIPPKFGKLTNLQQLYLIRNNLSYLPSEIGYLSNLEILNLHNNNLNTLPSEIGLLANLKYFILQNNIITTLPPEFGQLIKLEVLYLGGNQLNELLPEIGQLEKLTYLNLANNAVKKLPPEIGQLTKLEKLDLRGNQLNELPPEIGQLTEIKKLYLSSNQLITLPSEIGQLTELTELFLFDNKLKELPPEIGQLTNITKLYLRGNQLNELPLEIGQLTNLSVLSIRHNLFNDTEKKKIKALLPNCKIYF